jgi:flavodoxin I
MNWMRVLIIYDSVYGNTEKIARAVAGAIAPFGEIKVLRAGEANPSELGYIDLLIVGSPTQGGKPTPAIQEFLSKIPANALKNISVASFDTRIKMFVAKLFGYAAGRIADSLKSKGGNLAAPPEGFIVKGNEGPLKEGELERAADWGKRIAESKK